jgi:hypothetical protein
MVGHYPKAEVNPADMEMGAIGSVRPILFLDGSTDFVWPTLKKWMLPDVKYRQLVLFN